MVEVFKTDISDKILAQKIICHLESKIPKASINFDLEDHDRILRVENQESAVPCVTEYFQSAGFYCEELE